LPLMPAWGLRCCLESCGGEISATDHACTEGGGHSTGNIPDGETGRVAMARRQQPPAGTPRQSHHLSLALRSQQPKVGQCGPGDTDGVADFHICKISIYKTINSERVVHSQWL
jgi:hypothetical protein